jgi:hypothetical protein
MTKEFLLFTSCGAILVWGLYKMNQEPLSAGKAPQQDVAQDVHIDSPVKAAFSKPSSLCPLVAASGLNQAMHDCLTADPTKRPNVFNIPPEVWPTDPQLCRLFARQIIALLETIPATDPPQINWSGALNHFPTCAITTAAPPARIVEKKRYLEDVEIALEYINFLDFQHVKTTESDHWFPGLTLYDDVVIADAIEAGTRFRSRLYSLCEPMIADKAVANTMENLKNPNAVEPDSDLAKKRDAILTALAEASALEIQPSSK